MSFCVYRRRLRPKSWMRPKKLLKPNRNVKRKKQGMQMIFNARKGKTKPRLSLRIRERPRKPEG